jgi:chorismate mutase
MTKKLDEVRRKIDTLDDRIHDLLMERARLIVEVSEEKRKNKLQIIQPAREALMIRRLLGRHEGKLPKAAIVRIWRELVGAVSLLQTGLKVAVSVPEGKPHFWDMAKDYFGSVLPMQRVSHDLSAVAMVREGDANFAVIPWPRDGEENPWWVYLMSEDQDRMRIVVRLPYGDVREEPPDTENMALIVAKISFDSTGEDRSFLAIEIEQSVSRARIVDMAKEAGLEPLSMYSRKGPAQNELTAHLLEVEGHIQDGDKRIKELGKKLRDHKTRIVCVGGYPKPPAYEKIEDLRG